MREALDALDVPVESAVMRRFFLSDAANQQSVVEASALARPDDGGPVLHRPVWVQVAGHNLPSEVDLVTWDATGADLDSFGVGWNYRF